MDALQVHAAAAAVTAGGTAFKNVAVGEVNAAGRGVRIYYDGEREPQHTAGADETLGDKIIAQAVHIRGYWPVPETAAKRQRVMEGEMGAFVKSFRTRVEGDRQLGGEGIDLELGLASVNVTTIGNIRYVLIDMEAICDWDLYTIAP